MTRPIDVRKKKKKKRSSNNLPFDTLLLAVNVTRVKEVWGAIFARNPLLQQYQEPEMTNELVRYFVEKSSKSVDAGINRLVSFT